jgi:hypothetical protein
MDRSNLWRNPDHARCALLAGGILLLATGSLGQTTSDVTITYSYENGNRTLETIGTPGNITDPSTPTVTLSATNGADTETASTKTGNAYAFSHITATASGGTAPYVFQWAQNTQNANCNNFNKFLLKKGYWAAPASVTSTFESEENQGVTATLCTEWQLTVTDSLGTQSAPMSLTVTHIYSST